MAACLALISVFAKSPQMACWLAGEGYLEPFMFGEVAVCRPHGGGPCEIDGVDPWSARYMTVMVMTSPVLHIIHLSHTPTTGLR